MRLTDKERIAHIKNWRQNNLSKMEYCLKHKIGFSTFNKWIQTLDTSNSSKTKTSSKNTAPAKFVNLITKSQQEITIQLPNGISINYNGTLDQQLLKLLNNA